MNQQEILQAKKWDLNLLKRVDIPIEKGIYCYLNQVATSIEYVGSAVGLKGLRGRIWSQHLNPNYLENRSEKFSTKDKGQIQKNVIKRGKLVIEKSAFRKNVARQHDLTPGEPSVDFIKENFLLVYFAVNLEKEKIHEIEKRMIRDLNPKYNIRKY